MHGARRDLCALSNNRGPAWHEASAPIVQPMKCQSASNATTWPIERSRAGDGIEAKCRTTALLGVETT
jgi:hypothetical protein